MPLARPIKQGAGARTHDGFYLRFGIGAGFMLGGVEESEYRATGRVSGAASALEFAIGGNIAKGLVLGGGIYKSSIPKPKYDLSFSDPDTGRLVRASHGGTISADMAGPFLDWYFDAQEGGHVQFAIGFVSMSAERASDGNSFDGGNGYPGQGSSGFGSGAVLGAGYELWVAEQFSLGVLGRLHHFSGELKCSEFFCGPYGANHITANVFALLLTATYH